MVIDDDKNEDSHYIVYFLWTVVLGGMFTCFCWNKTRCNSVIDINKEEEEYLKENENDKKKDKEKNKEKINNDDKKNKWFKWLILN